MHVPKINESEPVILLLVLEVLDGKVRPCQCVGLDLLTLSERDIIPDVRVEFASSLADEVLLDLSYSGLSIGLSVSLSVLHLFLIVVSLGIEERVDHLDFNKEVRNGLLNFVWVNTWNGVVSQ